MMNEDVEFNTEIARVCQLSSQDHTVRLRVLRALLAYLHHCLPKMKAQSLHGTPPLLGIMFYRGRGYGYAVAKEHPTSFIRYPLTADKMILRFDREWEQTPQLWAATLPEDVRRPGALELLDAAASAVELELPQVATGLRDASTKLRECHLHLAFD
jgi:hypothetical protein